MGDEIAFIFPGQGSQFVGMGKDLVENYNSAAELMDKANHILDLDLKEICIEGPEDKLNHTANTQPAIFLISMIINNLLVEQGIKPDVVAGHSLGEYSALAAAGVFTFAEGLNLVRKRGQLMDEALPAGMGTMAAVIGLEQDKILSICKNIDGVCEIANYNCPGQIVISGTKAAINEAVKLCNNAGAKKVIELDVSGPFHSSLMEPAREKLKSEIDKLSMSSPAVPVVVNAFAKYTQKVEDVKKALVAQLTSSVRWSESMKKIINNGINTFIEVGPGRTLKGLMRRINRSVQVYSINDLASLEKVLTQVKERE